MKTKISILGENTVSQKPKKLIELKYFLDGKSEIHQAGLKAKEFKNIVLVARDYSEYEEEGYFDLILGYSNNSPHEDPLSTCLFLGKWSDGVVE
jgi:hypothetical protein